MTKRQYQINAFNVTTDTRNYIVTLERLNNDRNGNPRYKAVIISLEENTKRFFNAVYIFTGHYCEEYGEAQHIVKYYESTREE